MAGETRHSKCQEIIWALPSASHSSFGILSGAQDLPAEFCFWVTNAHAIMLIPQPVKAPYPSTALMRILCDKYLKQISAYLLSHYLRKITGDTNMITIGNMSTKLTVSLFLVFHLSSLILSNLSWSPLVNVLFPFYDPYIHWTRQGQHWGVYTDPFRYDQKIYLAAIYADGQEKVLEPSLQFEDSRLLYFVEGLIHSSRTQDVEAFLRWYRHEFFPQSTPIKALILRQEVRNIEPPGQNDLTNAFTIKWEHRYEPNL